MASSESRVGTFSVPTGFLTQLGERRLRLWR